MWSRRCEHLCGKGNIFVKDHEQCLPLFEGKMIWYFDHRFGTYEDQIQAQANQGKLPELNEQEHQNPFLLPISQYWIHESDFPPFMKDGRKAILVFWDVTNAVLLRSGVFCILPVVPCGHKLPIVVLDPKHSYDIAYLSTCFSSFIFDYVTRQNLEGTSLQSHEASSKKRPQIDFATRQYQLHKQQHEAGPSHQGDARPARTEKRKPHQTLSLETSKSQRQKTASSRDSLEDFAASLEAELRKEGQGDIWPADIKERQDTTFSPSLKDISTRLHAEFTKQDLSRGLNRDDQKELVLRKISYSIYNSIISNSLIHRLKKSEQGKGRYTQEELLQSKKSFKL
jgi:hypothetical protein